MVQARFLLVWWWPVPVHFIISDNSSSDRVGLMSSGGLGTVSPSMLINFLWMYRLFPLIRGLCDCHPVWVFLRTLSWSFY